VEGPKKLTFPLKHYDRDTFTYDTIGENAVGRTGVTFTIGPDGHATQVVVENLNVRGEGTFKRVSTPEHTSQSSAPAAASGNFAGLIDIHAVRKIYLEYRGSGSPTVILESGYRNDADIWNIELEPGMSHVFSQIAKFTRVCAYDRPGTFLDAEHFGAEHACLHAAHCTRSRFGSSCSAPEGARPRTVRLRREFLWRHLCQVIRQHLPERHCWNGAG